MKNIIFICLLLSQISVKSQNEISFPSSDRAVTITADWYFIKKGAPILLLCHQAGWSKGEYLESALTLNKLGFNCLAINQRSGDSVNNVVNATAREAKSKKIAAGYLDAEKDILTAIDYLFKNYAQKIILVGSSYSSSLVLKVAKSNANVLAVAAFSPGEYFSADANLITNSVKGLTKPVFITCAKDEIIDTEPIAKAITQKNLVFFKPECTGVHGSRALWNAEPCHDAYWKAFTGFLKGIK